MNRDSLAASSRLGTQVAVALAILVGATALWLRFQVAPGAMTGQARRVALLSDIFNYFHPLSQHVARRLSAGEIPLWNPHACSGIPLLATMQPAPFHPGSWLALVLPSHQAIAVVMFLSCVLGGWLCARLFREWQCNGFAAAAGGLLFVSVCLVGLTFWPPAVSTFLWLPWLYLCVEKLARGWSYRWWAGLALATAIQVLAGFPQLLVYSFELVVPFALLRLYQYRDTEEPWRSAARRAASLLAAWALGAGLAGVQLVPGLELVAESARLQSLDAAQIHYLTGEHSPMLSDVVKRALDPAPSMAGSFLGGSEYLGISTLVLLLVGIAAQWRAGLTWLLLAISALALLLADGYNGWGESLYSLYARIPLVGALRTPERMRLLAEFCAICLAVTGFDRLGRPQTSSAQTLRMRATVAVATLLVCAGMGFAGTLAGAWRAVATGVLALALLQLQSPGHSGRRTLVQALLVLLLLADLLLGTGSYGVLRAFPLERTQSLVARRGGGTLGIEGLRASLDEVDQGRVAFLGFQPIMASEPLHEVNRVDCYEPLLPRQWPELHRAIRGNDRWGPTLRSDRSGPFRSFFEVAGVQRVFRPNAHGRPRHDTLPDALPRAYLIDRYRVVPRAEAITHVAAGDMDFHRLVLLDRDPGIVEADRGLRAAEIVEYAPERVVVEPHSDAPALLVLSDTHYPGWQARVDGERRDILLANGLYRAVVVAAGVQRVVFEYRPVSLRVGAACSALSLLLLLGAGLVKRSGEGS